MSATLLMEPGPRIGSTPPALRRSGPRIPAPYALALLVLLGVLLHVLDSETLPIRRVRVSGEFRHLAPHELQRIAEDVVRGGFFNVNVVAIQRRLSAEPWVAGVSVRRNWPDGIDLQVTERRPIARWGENALLDGSGNPFAPPAASFPAGLPVLQGPEGSEAVVLETFHKVQEKIAGPGIRIAAITLNPRRSWSFVIADGPTVVLGRQDVDRRLDRFAVALSKHLFPYLARIAAVDTRYTNGVAVRWNDAPAGAELLNAAARESYGQEN